jgi:hypothetical protein
MVHDEGAPSFEWGSTVDSRRVPDRTLTDPLRGRSRTSPVEQSIGSAGGGGSLPTSPAGRSAPFNGRLLSGAVETVSQLLLGVQSGDNVRAPGHAGS